MVSTASVTMGSEITLKDAIELREHFRYSAETERQLVPLEQLGSIAGNLLAITGLALLAAKRRRSGAALSALGAGLAAVSETALRQSAGRAKRFEAKADNVQSLIDSRQDASGPSETAV